MRVNSDALFQASRALGVTGLGAAQTEFLDGEVHQTLDVGAIARRSRTPAQSAGMFTGLMRNIHAAAGDLSTTQRPYSPTGSSAIPPYPDNVSSLFDIWVLGAALERFAGADALTQATLYAVFDSTVMGWGLDDSDVAVGASNLRIPLVRWDGLITQGGGTTYGVLPDGSTWARIGIRLAPTQTAMRLEFDSTAATVAATFDCTVLMGMFPVALGQDVVVG